MDSNYKILLVDDEPDILEFLGYNLKKAGYEIYAPKTEKEAITIAREILPHLILLDVMMPEVDGIATCEDIRTYPELNNTIIAFLTARSEDYSQIAGFEAGGDDYITKPIKPKVLLSRIKALLKRFGRQSFEREVREEGGKIKRGNLVIDREKYIVLVKNNELVLPKKEFELLLLISSKPDKVFTRDEIFSQVWGDD